MCWYFICLGISVQPCVLMFYLFRHKCTAMCAGYLFRHKCTAVCAGVLFVKA